MPSPYVGMVIKDLLKFTVNEVGKKIFDKKPSSFSEAEIKKLVKVMNDRLYKLEKTGQDEYSVLYNNIDKYAKNQIDNKGIFNITKGGKPRITSDLSRFGSTMKERYENISRLLGYLTSKTSTATGTKEVMKKRYETFKQNPDIKGHDFTLDQYKELWSAYRKYVREDMKEKYGSDVVLSAIKEGFYDMNPSQLMKAMKYVNRLKSVEKDSGLKELFNKWVKGGLITTKLK